SRRSCDCARRRREQRLRTQKFECHSAGAVEANTRNADGRRIGYPTSSERARFCETTRRSKRLFSFAGAADLMRVVRGVTVVLAVVLIASVFVVCLNAQSQPNVAASDASGPANAPTYEITGVVKNGKTLLPGVTVTASNTLTGKKYSTVSSTNGAF